jgi:hypothetical protein
MNSTRFLKSLLLFLISGCGFDLVNIEYDHEKFNAVADIIMNNPQIFQMDDFTRHNKYLNGISVKITDAEGDSTDQLLYRVEDSLGLEAKVVNALRIQLEETKLRDFYRSGDTILFTVDGMLDTSWGFLYSASNLKMDSAWFNFHGNSLLYTKDINSHWKKVAIK